MDMSGQGGMENHELTTRVLFFSFAELQSVTFWPDIITIILITADLKFRYNSILLFCRKGFQPARQNAL